MFRTIALVAVLLAAGGCGKKTKKGDAPTPDSDGDSGNPITRNIGKQPAVNDIQRGAEKQVDQAALEQIAKVYIQFELENNRSPANVDELLGAMRGFPAQ